MQKAFLKRVLEHLNGIRSLKHLVHFQMVDKWFFRKIPCKSTVITAAHPWLQAYKGCVLGSGPDSEVREAHAAHFQIRSAVRKCNSGLGDLVVKYQRIMVKHMVINLTGTILQFESGFFICLGCAGLRIQKKVGKAVLSVKGQAVIASLGVWQNRDIKRRMSASLLFATFQLTVRVRPFRMWRMRSTKSKG